jgi:hypothetical protein
MRVTPIVIHRLYKEALVGRGDTEPGITVRGFDSEASHTFHRRRLERVYTQLISAVKNLPAECMHSYNPFGVPWVRACNRTPNAGPWSIEATEELLMMAVAAGIVTRIEGVRTECDIPYITVNDDTLRRLERTKPGWARRRQVADWKPPLRPSI